MKAKIMSYEENHLEVSPQISRFKMCRSVSVTLFYQPHLNLHESFLSTALPNKIFTRTCSLKEFL